MNTGKPENQGWETCSSNTLQFRKVEDYIPQQLRRMGIKLYELDGGEVKSLLKKATLWNCDAATMVTNKSMEELWTTMVSRKSLVDLNALKIKDLPLIMPLDDFTE